MTRRIIITTEPGTDPQAPPINRAYKEKDDGQQKCIAVSSQDPNEFHNTIQKRFPRTPIVTR